MVPDELLHPSVCSQVGVWSQLDFEGRFLVFFLGILVLGPENGAGHVRSLAELLEVGAQDLVCVHFSVGGAELDHLVVASYLFCEQVRIWTHFFLGGGIIIFGKIFQNPFRVLCRRLWRDLFFISVKAEAWDLLIAPLLDFDTFLIGSGAFLRDPIRVNHG